MKRFLLISIVLCCCKVASAQEPGGRPLEAQGVARIGYDAFKIDVSKIVPGPVDKSYVLSPGDKLVLRVWGQLQLTYNLTVTDALYLEIPEVPGRVYVGDLPLGEVEDRIRRQMATVYATYFNLDNPAASAAFIDLALAEVRDLRFLVQGEVATPGSYSLHPSLGNIIYALARAGGVKETGSLRNIRIRRGTTVVDFDFYDFLIRGRADVAQMQIRNNDVIFVPLKRKEVTIQGEVRRPGIYALHESADEDLDALLEFAGGFKPSASTDKLLIHRTDLNVGLKTLSVNLDEVRRAGRGVSLQDQDVVTVFATNKLRLDYVVLRGRGVRVPGEYQFKPGMRVNDLVREAGELLPDAYLERADLLRFGTDMLRDYAQVDLRKAAKGEEAHNLKLDPLDELVVYNVRDIEGEEKHVTLRGHVKTPGRVAFYRDMRLYDLLFGRGGFQDKDFLRETYLERADLLRAVAGGARKELVKFNLGKLLEGDPTENLALQSDDEVVVYSRRDILGGERFVTLSGHAKNAGRHDLFQGIRLLDLLRTAGGYEDPDFRREAYLPRGDVLRPVSRGDRVEKELIRFNLGAVLDGDSSQNIELQSGDEVVLYAAKDFEEKRFVEIDGAVNKPGRYELASNMTLDDLVIRGGGLKELADPSTADLFRAAVSADGQVKLETLQVLLSDKSFALRNNDRLLVRMRAGYQPARVVEVTGQVQYPGRYTLTVGSERIADVIRMAGGVRGDAFLEGASLLRRSESEGGGSNRSRIILDFGRALENASSTDNLVLEDGDLVHVPRRSNTVTVVNEVNQPITIAYQKGKGVEYYLQAAGGLTANADEKAVAVILPNGRYAPKRLWRGPEILPGSVINVPSRGTAPTVTTTTSGLSATAPVVGAIPVVPPAGATTTVSTTTTAPPAKESVAPKPEELPAQVQPTVSLSGTVGGLTGNCPTLSFVVGTERVTTTAGTVVVGAVCTDLKNGDVIEAEGVRQGDGSVVATAIKRKEDP